MRMLLIEDDAAVAEAVVAGLSGQYLVEVAATGKRGLYRAQTNDFAAVVLDLGLPDIDGREVCVELRRDRIQTPILVLSGTREVSARVDALNAGADDYLVKPFAMDELKARLQALVRRTISQRHPVLTTGTLCLDPIRRQLTVKRVEVPLRRREFELLEYLLSYQGHVLDRGRILDAVWGDSTDAMTNTVDVHIKLLRDKVDRPFGTNHIQTVRGVGYKII